MSYIDRACVVFNLDNDGSFTCNEERLIINLLTQMLMSSEAALNNIEGADDDMSESDMSKFSAAAGVALGMLQKARTDFIMLALRKRHKLADIVKDSRVKDIIHAVDVANAHANTWLLYFENRRSKAASSGNSWFYSCYDDLCKVYGNLEYWTQNILTVLDESYDSQ